MDLRILFWRSRQTWWRCCRFAQSSWCYPASHYCWCRSVSRTILTSFLNFPSFRRRKWLLSHRGTGSTRCPVWFPSRVLTPHSENSWWTRTELPALRILQPRGRFVLGEILDTNSIDILTNHKCCTTYLEKIIALKCFCFVKTLDCYGKVT